MKVQMEKYLRSYFLKGIEILVMQKIDTCYQMIIELQKIWAYKGKIKKLEKIISLTIACDARNSR